MKIAIGCDHGGFILKQPITDFLKKYGHEIIDLGTNSEAAVDYPDYSLAVGKAVVEGKAERGILICGSGVGACVAVNKIPGIRAGLCHDTFSAHQGKEDDDTNVLCLGARIIGVQLALEVVKTWIEAQFSGAERHVRRLHKVQKIEQEYLEKSAVKK
ncbi:MAG TPA: ribose 5-phosphate isomerase B [Oculatellaceae cyanobacterium]